jgi:hypothetical protein
MKGGRSSSCRAKEVRGVQPVVRAQVRRACILLEDALSERLAKVHSPGTSIMFLRGEGRVDPELCSYPLTVKRLVDE